MWWMREYHEGSSESFGHHHGGTASGGRLRVKEKMRERERRGIGKLKREVLKFFLIILRGFNK